MAQHTEQSTSICLVGMAPDTGNLGVSALCGSVLHGISTRVGNADLAVWDHRSGTGPLSWRIGERDIQAVRYGAYHTKRLYRPECLWNIQTCARLGGLWNAAARKVLASNAILDISGGDSFTDMYGPWRFRAVTQPKLIAIEQGKPLILLPQTYGPFQEAPNREIARKIVCAAAMAWARDGRSFEVLKDLLGDAFDPARHRVGVDVAFGLPATRPSSENIAGALDWLERGQTPLAGLNVSGLLLNRPREAAEQYGLKADYCQVLLTFVRRLMKESDARVLLVPHVVSPPGHHESDIEACETIAAELGNAYSDRVAVAPVVHDPCEVKWIIARCDWFCGTRMHSTIAALSSGVPTAAISYSPKTLGVFETCAQGEHVVDPQQQGTGEAVDHLWRSWLGRESARGSLGFALPKVLRQAESQLDEIVAACVSYPPSRFARVR